MLRFIVNVSLIICLAVADVIAQDDKVTIARIAGAAPAKSLAISAGSGGDELSKLPSMVTTLLSLSFHLFTPMAFHFLSPMAFLARNKIPENFDVTNCRLTLDLSQLQNPVSTNAYFRGKTVYVIVKSSAPKSKRNINGVDSDGSRLSQQVVSRVVPDSCLIDIERVVSHRNDEVLTITFPHFSPRDKRPLVIPQIFDPLLCRLAADLSVLPKPAIKTVEMTRRPRFGKVVHIQVTTASLTRDIISPIFPACLDDLKKASVKFSKKTKLLTITFAQAFPDAPNFIPSEDEANNPFPTADDETVRTSSDDYDEGRPEDDEPQQSQADNGPQDGEGAGESNEGNLVPQPFLLFITK